ncbi:MAG: glycine cleavage system aminomethyltransferase GcvT [Steroidobacteraceae bacterium]
MVRETPLASLHRALGACMVDFGGWALPLHFGSQIAEHHAVRRTAGLFDVSHMGIVDVSGPGARGLLERLLANDVGKLQAAGKALYGCLLDDSGGVIDDLIAYFLGPEHGFRLVVNGATRDGDLAWLRGHASGYDATITERTELVLLAVQGPAARERLASLLPPAEAALALGLGAFQGSPVGRWFVARTGYTGEDGFEVMLPAAQAEAVWRRLNDLGVQSCGLGARDTLRLEAGLNLYGADMDRGTHPFESRLGWTVALGPPGRAFIGRAALAAVAASSPRKLTGLVLEARGVLRAHQRVSVPGVGEGTVTSGTFSPTLQRSIALARVPSDTGAAVQVEVRGQWLDARVVEPPFVRRGRSLID